MAEIRRGPAHRTIQTDAVQRSAFEKFPDLIVKHAAVISIKDCFPVMFDQIDECCFCPHMSGWQWIYGIIFYLKFFKWSQFMKLHIVPDFGNRKSVGKFF